MPIDKPADESPAIAEVCANCRFGATEVEMEIGTGKSIVCRRFPDYQQRHREDWCGEYAAR